MEDERSAEAHDVALSCLPEVTERQRFLLRKAIYKNRVRPTRVAVMGQTGVGKSTMINSLFGSDLETGSVRPTTTAPAEVERKLEGGRSVVFVDLPGIGESRDADTRYLDMYMSEFRDADILLWLFSAESRSLRIDMDTLNGLAGLDRNRTSILDKVVFGLTKADLATPAPWILSHDGDRASFANMQQNEVLLLEKAAFVRESAREVLGFVEQRPIVVTSTRFRIGLLELLLGILGATDDATVARLGPVFDLGSISSMPVIEALSYRNFKVFDTRTGERDNFAPKRSETLT